MSDELHPTLRASWRVEPDPHATGSWRVVCEERGRIVARCAAVDPEEAHAIARAVAALPGLLRAADDATSDLGDLERHSGSEGCREQAAGARRELRSAVRFATDGRVLPLSEHGAREVLDRVIRERVRLVDLLRCLTGYVESREREGDLRAPVMHAKEARALLTAIEEGKGV